MTDALPILYSFRRCPYAMRARLAVAAAGITVELREVLLRDKPAEMIDASPKATVPVLILTDGTVIDESLDVMRWALARHDPDQWWPDDPATRNQIDALVARNDGPFKNALDRYKYPNRYGSESNSSIDHRATAAGIVSDYETRLAATGWLTGPRASLADYAILPFVRQFAHVDRPWFDSQLWPHVIRWLDAFLGSHRFTAIMGKHPQWRAGAGKVLFPPAKHHAVGVKADGHQPVLAPGS